MRYLLSSCLCIAGLGALLFFFEKSHKASVPVSIPASNSNWITQEAQIIHTQANNLDPTVLKICLTAYLKARAHGLDEKQMLTVIDYSKPSNERRLWVIDVKNMKVLFNTWVAHGKYSGGLYATSFSNAPHSLKSSLGVFVTTQSYFGGHGYSLRIQGLEHGFNDNAYNRDVVFHGAWYAGADMAKMRGMLGRSWGCMAVGENTIKSLVDAIKNNTVVVAYFPDAKWLRDSTWVNA